MHKVFRCHAILCFQKKIEIWGRNAFFDTFETTTNKSSLWDTSHFFVRSMRSSHEFGQWLVSSHAFGANSVGLETLICLQGAGEQQYGVPFWHWIAIPEVFQSDLRKLLQVASTDCISHSIPMNYSLNHHQTSIFLWNEQSPCLVLDSETSPLSIAEWMAWATEKKHFLGAPSGDFGRRHGDFMGLKQHKRLLDRIETTEMVISWDIIGVSWVYLTGQSNMAGKS